MRWIRSAGDAKCEQNFVGLKNASFFDDKRVQGQQGYG